jgi:hypothetical protein
MKIKLSRLLAALMPAVALIAAPNISPARRRRKRFQHFRRGYRQQRATLDQLVWDSILSGIVGQLGRQQQCEFRFNPN